MSRTWDLSLEGIGYEELPGSPSFAGGRDGPTAHRSFMLDWSNAGAYVTKFFPAAIRTGKGWIFPVALAFPGRPYLVASTYKIEGWDHDKTPGVDSDNVRAYDYAKVDIDYKAPDYDPEDRGKDPTQTGDQILADHSMAFSAEMLKLGISGWMWEFDPDDPIKNEDASLAKVVPQIEHTLAWNYVPLPPFRRIARYVGCVNSDTKLFYAAAETLLFIGAEIKRSYHSQTGDESWKVTYKFLQRCINDETDTVIGWNHLWSNETGTWRKPTAFTGDASNPAEVIDLDKWKYIYEGVPFADLFQSDESDDT